MVEQENFKICRLNRVVGLFVCITPKTADLAALNRIEEQGIPVIFFDKVPAIDTVNKVCVADDEVSALASQALIEKNKKNILALFGDPAMSITAKRLRGFAKQFLNYPETKIHIEHSYSREDAERITRMYCSSQERPDGIFCMSDEILTGVMKVIQQQKIQVPNDISIIAISNGFIPHLYYPEISYVLTSGAKLAQLAFKRMTACLTGSTFKQELNLEPVFVEGGSL